MRIAAEYNARTHVLYKTKADTPSTFSDPPRQEPAVFTDPRIAVEKTAIFGARVGSWRTKSGHQDLLARHRQACLIFLVYS